MKEKKRKEHLKKLLNMVKKKIESNAYSIEPLNAIDLRISLVGIIMDFCGYLEDEESYIAHTDSYYNFADKLIERIKPLLDVKIRNMLIIDKCSICGRFLDDSKLFPEDFPTKFKICCNCKRVVDYIYKLDHPIDYNKYSESDFLRYYENYQEKFDNLLVIKKCQKIN